MNTLRTTTFYAFLALACVSLGACGQMGPLYAPEDAPYPTGSSSDNPADEPSESDAATTEALQP